MAYAISEDLSLRIPKSCMIKYQSSPTELDNSKMPSQKNVVHGAWQILIRFWHLTCYVSNVPWKGKPLRQ